MRSYLAYEMAKASAELKRDMETTLLSDQPAAIGASGTARKTAGLGTWIITNWVSAAGSGSAGTMSGATNPAGNAAITGSAAEGSPSAKAAAQTLTAFTETMLKTAIQKVWTQGGDPKIAMMGPVNKAKASAFAGIAPVRYNVGDVEPAAIIGAADVYLSDFGEVRMVPNRFQVEDRAYIFDPEYASVSYLRNFRTEVLAKTGDAEKRAIVVEYGLKVRTEKAFAQIRDLLTT